MCDVQCDHGFTCFVSYIHSAHHTRDGCYILFLNRGIGMAVIEKTSEGIKVYPEFKDGLTKYKLETRQWTPK